MAEYFKKYKKFDIEEIWQEKAKQYELKKKNTTWRETCEKFTTVLCEECNDAQGAFYEFMI